MMYSDFAFEMVNRVCYVASKDWSSFDMTKDYQSLSTIKDLVSFDDKKVILLNVINTISDEGYLHYQSFPHVMCGFCCFLFEKYYLKVQNHISDLKLTVDQILSLYEMSLGKLAEIPLFNPRIPSLDDHGPNYDNIEWHCDKIYSLECLIKECHIDYDSLIKFINKVW